MWQFREEGETGGNRRGRGGEEREEEEVKGACQDVGRDNSPGDTFPS